MSEEKNDDGFEGKKIKVVVSELSSRLPFTSSSN
jgi:hypothetical protein